MTKLIWAIAAITVLGFGYIAGNCGRSADLPEVGNSPSTASPPHSPLSSAVFQSGDDYYATSNGVKLEVSWTVRETLEGRVIDLHWKITNVGARDPLVIVKPSLTNPTGATYVRFLARQNDDSRGYDYVKRNSIALDFFAQQLFWPLGIPTMRLDKKWYATIPKGKSDTGTLTVTVAELKEYFLKTAPDDFDRIKPPAFQVNLSHAPLVRGEALELDAWTGGVGTKLHAIPRFDSW